MERTDGHRSHLDRTWGTAVEGLPKSPDRAAFDIEHRVVERENPPNPARFVIRCAIMLTINERRVLDFERSWWTLPGPKDRDIIEVLGVSSAEYYQVLRELINKPAALAYDPLTVRRLRGILAAAHRALRAPAGVSSSGE